MTATNVAARPSSALPRMLTAALIALAMLLVVAHRAYQTVEISLAGLLLHVFTSSGVYVVAGQQTVYFGLGSTHPLGLTMTPECTSAFLLIPLVLVSAVLVTLRPAIATRVLGSLALAALILIVVNQLRIMTLAALVGWLGTDRGYYWGHTMIGSLVSVFGGAIALVLFVWLATRRSRVERRNERRERA
ncbi:MAG TPA: exosortase P [Pseudonocardiaceae bacterium]|nr:exosortase P [Pseudonocardiaceae bacterium]